MLRRTQQREIVTQMLQEAEGPLTVQEILVRGRKSLPRLGIATVYREVHRMVEAKELSLVVIPGDSPRYEIAKQHHHHFKCTECAKVYGLDGCVQELKTLVPAGFKMQAHEITFYGLCRVCA